MIDTLPSSIETMSASAQMRRAAVARALLLAGVIGCAGLASLWLALRGPDPALLGWLCYALGAAAIVYQPRYGVYLIVGLALVGDQQLVPWYPFVKNFSSAESLLYIHDALIVSPAETYILLTAVAWLGLAAMRRRLTLHIGPLFWPALIFIAFITFGLIYGLGRGGDVVIGLWEARAVYYLPALLVLTSNLIETREHVGQLLWVMIVGLFVSGLSGAWHVIYDLGFDIASADSIAEHTTSILWNSFFVLAIAPWIVRASYVKRLVPLAMLPLVLLAYIANQRRAAFVALAVALVLLAIVQYRESRTVFWLVMPAVSLVVLLYLGMFWNSAGALGLPARSIKAILAPDDSNTRDAMSNLYRTLENINIQYTIRAAPLTGVGFGQKFYIVAPMADISFFAWWQYITHNSILWIWLKAGLGGFVALLVLIGLSIVVGIRGLARASISELRIAALVATLTIIMHFMFAYVDMSWGERSMIYIGTLMGLLNSLERIADRHVPMLRLRWPWQAAGVLERTEL